jgi:hypothetical protein
MRNSIDSRPPSSVHLSDALTRLALAPPFGRQFSMPNCATSPQPVVANRAGHPSGDRGQQPGRTVAAERGRADGSPGHTNRLIRQFVFPIENIFRVLARRHMCMQRDWNPVLASKGL